MDAFLTVLLVLLIYPAVCFLIAIIRASFSEAGKKEQHFKETFQSFFLEMLNPFNWL